LGIVFKNFQNLTGASMKYSISAILTIIAFTAFGQKIHFQCSSEIQNTKDSTIAAVRDLWKAYLINSKEGFGKPSLEYWNNIESDNGFTDIVKAAISIPSYGGDFQVYDIKKLENDYYRIRTIWSLDDPGNKLILAIFNVYAKKEASGYKLYNNFFLIKPKLKHSQIDNIDFYYPDNYSFDSLKARQMADFYYRISFLYMNKDFRKVTYIIGNNLDEANKMIGFDYTIYSSSFPDAAYTIKGQNIIIACREDNKHEVIHSIFLHMFPEANSLFQEGIATYYGGSAGQDYINLIKHLRNMINNNPDIDLSKFDDLFAVLDNGTNNFYIVGAILIEYALKIGGIDKVLALLQYPDSTDDPNSIIEKELGIKKEQIDQFLKDYIQNYCVPKSL
jgi:hypothetical protein